MLIKKIIKHKSLLIKVLISACVFAILFARMDRKAFYTILETARFDSVSTAIAIILVFGQILALSYRWMILINTGDDKLSYKQSLSITLSSLLANYLFITSIGGIVVRVALSVRHGVTWIKSATAVTLDRLMTLFALIILAALFVPFLYEIVSRHIFDMTFALTLLFVTIGIIAPLLFFKTTHGQHAKKQQKIIECLGYLREIYTNHPLMARITLSSLTAQCCYFGAILVMTYTLATDIEFSILHLMAVIPVMTLIASLPIGYGGWGIREGAFIFGMGLVEIPMEIAFIISVEVGLLCMFATIIASIPFLLGRENPFFVKQQHP